MPKKVSKLVKKSNPKKQIIKAVRKIAKITNPVVKDSRVTVCPSCGSQNVGANVSLPTSGEYMAGHSQQICKDCGYIGSTFPDILKSQMEKMAHDPGFIKQPVVAEPELIDKGMLTFIDKSPFLTFGIAVLVSAVLVFFGFKILFSVSFLGWVLVFAPLVMIPASLFLIHYAKERLSSVDRLKYTKLMWLSFWFAVFILWAVLILILVVKP